MTEEQKISQRYRELGREEPPREIDAAILAAARRGAETRPAPLVVPTGRRRWYFPLAAAAVIVLAVAVTIHVEREQPDPEAVIAPSANVLRDVAKAEQAAPAPQPAPASPPAPARKAAPAQQEFTPDPKPQARPEPAPASPPQAMQESQPAAAVDQRLRDQDRLDSQRLAHERERLAQERAAQDSLEKRRGAAATGSVAAKPEPDLMRQQGARRLPALSAFAEQSPEQWLQGIDDLKRQGRHDEAEKQLAEFRKRYPNYRIPEAISEKFEKR